MHALYPRAGWQVIASALLCSIPISLSCGGTSFSPVSAAPDAGLDATADTAPPSDAPVDTLQDAVADAVAEAAADASEEAAADAAPDAGPDALQDAAAEAAPDASPACQDIAVPASACTTNNQCGQEVFLPEQTGRYNFGLALDDEYAYWAAQSDYNGNGDGVIMRKPLNEPEASPEVFSAVMARPVDVELDATTVFWLVRGSTTPQVRAAPRDCEPPCAGTVIKEYPAHSLLDLKRVGPDRLFVLSRENVYVLSGSGTTWSQKAAFGSNEYPALAPSWDGVYFSTVRETNIRRFSLDGTLESSFAQFNTSSTDTNAPGPSHLAASCDFVYALDVAGALYALDKATSVQTKIVPKVEGDLWGMAVDAQFIYVHRANAGGITRIRRDTHAVTQHGAANVFTMAVNATHVYYDNHANGAIMRLVK